MTFCEFIASLVYKVNSKTVRVVTEKPCLEKQTTITKQNKKQDNNKKNKKITTKQKANKKILSLYP